MRAYFSLLELKEIAGVVRITSREDIINWKYITLMFRTSQNL